MNYVPIDNKTLNVPAPLVEATLQYLWTRPMNEVFDLFTQWQAALRGPVVEQATPAPPAAPVAPAPAPIGQAMHRDELATVG
jgi:hypothetical protein